MAKIQCQHCKAVNQDVSSDDPCWQCGTILGAPPSALDTGVGASTSEANAPTVPTVPVQKQIQHPQSPDKVPLTERYAPSTPNYGAIAIGVMILIIAIVALLFALKIIHL